jgi:thyrotropin-releasing hormone receptor
MEELCLNISLLLNLSSSGLAGGPIPPLLPQNLTYSAFLAQNCSEYPLEELYDPEYYSYTYRIVGTVFQGIILLVGLLGNVLVVLVVAKTKSMHSPTNCYLVSLALADIIVLAASVPNELIFYYVIGDKWIWGEWGCAVFSFFQYLGINASSLSLTAFTVERYIAICHPMKAQTMCTVNRAKRIILAVWVFSVIYCAPWLTLTKLIPIPYRGFEDVQKCSFKLSRQEYVYYYFVDLLAFYVLPLLLSVVLYGLIARILFASHSVSVKSTVGGKTINGQLTVDSTKTNAARTQVSLQRLLNYKIHNIKSVFVCSFAAPLSPPKLLNNLHEL